MEITARRLQLLVRGAVRPLVRRFGLAAVLPLFLLTAYGPAFAIVEVATLAGLR